MNSKALNFLNSLNNKCIALCGIGSTNLPLANLFLKYGAKIIACDSRSREDIGENAKHLENIGVKLKLGKDYLKDLNADIVFRTPGIKFYTPELNYLRDKGTIVTSEMEVFFDLCPCKIFAITGSDGKTTTTTIISEILKQSGKTVHLGGNIGNPLLQNIENIKDDDIAVIELSSFQLISMRKSPDIAVITNLAPNHLDMHKDMTEYIDAKKNILLHQNAFSRTVLNLDNEITKGFSDFVRGEKLFFSRNKKNINGAWLNNNKIIMSYKGKNYEIMDIHDIKIPGNHNIENYLAAISAVWEFVKIEDIVNVAKSFNGVEHRAEFVREVNGIKFYNDSIASSPTRTASGTLSLYDKKIIMIAGGYDKKIPFDELGPVIVNKVKTLILMGDTADKIETAVKRASAYKLGNPNIIKVNSMEEAVQKSFQIAENGDIVSLSPACASFDMYKNFAARGNHFKKLVNNL